MWVKKQKRFKPKPSSVYIYIYIVLAFVHSPTSKHDMFISMGLEYIGTWINLKVHMKKHKKQNYIQLMYDRITFQGKHPLQQNHVATELDNSSRPCSPKPLGR